MSNAIKEKLIGARIPVPLKETLDKYCREHGIKMNFFVVHAIKEKLLESIEDEDDIRVVTERLKKPDFATAREFSDYLARRGTKV
jgi:hypothetical protein